MTRAFQEGIVPLEWKEANIIPLFKKGSRNKSVNYRPVSLTSVICKLLEAIIRDHMMDFLIKHKLINPSQHGFLKARSCLTNLLCFLEEITKWVDDGSPITITITVAIKLSITITITVVIEKAITITITIIRLRLRLQLFVYHGNDSRLFIRHVHLQYYHA